MQRTSKDVAEFLASLEGTQGDDMRRLDDLISERMPGQPRFLYEGVFWSGSEQQIVGYGVMDYENRSGVMVEWFLVGFAVQKDHISIYVNAVEDGQYLLGQYEGKLGKPSWAAPVSPSRPSPTSISTISSRWSPGRLSSALLDHAGVLVHHGQDLGHVEVGVGVGGHQAEDPRLGAG